MDKNPPKSQITFAVRFRDLPGDMGVALWLSGMTAPKRRRGIAPSSARAAAGIEPLAAHPRKRRGTTGTNGM